MPLKMDDAYRAAKIKNMTENAERLERQVIEAFGGKKGSALLHGLFPDAARPEPKPDLKKKSIN